MEPQPSSRPNKPIAIIGTGLRFPGDANTPAKLWNLLSNPRDVQSVIPPTRFNADGFYNRESHQGTSQTRHGYFLSEDHRVFDADFFGIKPVEAKSMDPQQRMLLEVIYEGLEAAGLSVETMRGSSTAVYVGLMAGDYGDMLNRDITDIPPYVAAGNARSMMSNRVSYVFDWCGPSMTIDTACSSSLVAVHHAVQSLRLGESRVAVAAGVNLILGPEQFIAGSNMKMMSPEGRSYMWDSRANGYARGEGVAAVVLKTLSAAIEDGDEIESVIVETGLNQDGRTKGLTVPSATAQTKLIQATYRKAGLDLSKLSDRPQYFEAHGTGTPAGDPVEAQATRDAFFCSPTEDDRPGREPLYCGSIKTIIGHTEGTAGLAGLIKASLAVQRGVIPPNRLFEELAPSVKPFYKDLKIVTEAKQWPALALGAVRRASVNSFGFGGTNAHCILESYSPAKAEKSNNSTRHLPFVFSAASERSLMSMLSAFSNYLKTTPLIDLRALSYTLATKRTTCSVRATFSASNVVALCSDLEEYLQGKDTRPSLVEPLRASPLRILGIFTGQGAQWAGMGRMLMQFPAALDIIDMLERSLAELPDPPSWSLKNELAADASCSRVKEAAIAQPICTAAQILLIEILRAAGIRFSTVVGHSSGEIAAAFAADRLSARDAIRISYYRGVHLPLVGGTNGETGAMIAVGASYEEAQSICDSDRFRGKLCVGASNSAASVTLSGDIAAVNDVKVMFHTQNRFARLLRVDNAYHSHHMTRCSEAITASVRACNIKFQRPASSACKWVSSVDMVPVTDDLEIFDYWHRNTIGCVFFSQALEHALGLSDYDIAVEVGAHPALKGPALQVIESVLGRTIPYTGLLSRNQDDTRAVTDGLGYIWANTGARVVDFAGYDRFISGLRRPRILKDLPLYPWDHERAFWYESRNSHTFRNRPRQHALLGTPISDFSTDYIAWKKFIMPKEIPWISGHQIQGQMIFPGSAYIVSAVEAAREAAAGQSVQLVELTNFVFGQPLVFDSEDTRIEILITLAGIQRHKSSWTARFTYHSVNSRTLGPMSLNADCQVRILFGQEQNLWSDHSEIELGMLDVDHERIYTSLARCGYHYAGAFKALHSVRRKIGIASGLIKVPERTAVAPILHPATVDAAIHSIAVAHSYPGDGRLTSVLPIDVSRISIDLTQATSSAGDGYLRFTSFSREEGGGDVDMYPTHESSAILRLEGLRTKPMAAMNPSNDIQMFSETFWGPSAPMLSQTSIDPTITKSQQNLHIIAEIASQLSHRYPALKIMSIGTCTVEATNHFLTRMNGVLSSYTHTDISCDRLNQAKLAFDCFNDKTIYKTLDMSNDLTEQDFPEYSFDLVVSLSNNAEILDLDHTVKSIRRLLRPGGFFLCPRLADISQLMPNIINNNARENHQPFAPSDTVMKRAQTLENYGFAETEWLQESPIMDISQRPVMFLQAIDDRVKLLRDPLSPIHPPLLFSGITIVGGATSATRPCIKKLKTAFSAYSTSLAHVETLANVADSDFAFGGNVVVLQDHDKPLFADFSSSTLEGLQRLFRRSRDVLWVTHGYKQNSPHARMLVSFARCLVLEMPHIRLQILDSPSMETPNATVISESLLKLLITGKWEDEGFLTDMLWSIEPEISHMNGHQYVPRMKVSESRNNRYNSTRRIIKSTTDPSVTPVALSMGDGTYALKIKKLPDSALKSKDFDIVRIRVKYSSLKAVKTKHFGNYYLVLGINTVTNEQVIALSSTLCSVVDVPLSLVRSSSLPPDQAVGYLQALAFSLISITALEDLLSGQSLLVLEPHPDFAPILTQFAAARDVHVEFCTATKESHGRTVGRPWRYVPAHASKRYIKAALLGSTSSRVVCWKANDWTSRVLETLSKDATVDELSPSVIRQDVQTCSSKTSGASLVLDCAQGRLPLIQSSIVLTDAIPLQLKDLHGSNIKADDMGIVNWSNLTDIPVRVEPADQQVCFRSDRTYWLVGLTGELGLSLCEWMIARNSRNIVLSSRSPDIDSRWIAHFASLGATVKIYSCDVTDYNSVEKVHEDIKTHLPPVAGVCHGAMVLRDSLIQDLDLQKVNQVLKPKMDGAIHLNRVFQHQHLDFFIMLSSIAAVTGNPGQAAYAAGNAFLAALTAQRRARGQPSSCIALGAILGNGYATRGLTSLQQISLEKAGVMWTSEQDFHTAFAEAVLASPPSPGESGEFGTGVPITYTDQKYKPKHSSNPIFSHLLLQRARSGRNLSGTPTVSTKAQLLHATTMKEVQHILDGFLELRLRKALQMVPDANVLEQTAEALGIDSLIAVEMKSWLMRELGVDIPVLIIIGGNTMRGVLAHCVQLLDPILIPQLKLTTDGSPTKSMQATESPTRSKGALHPLQPAPPAVAESGAIGTSLSNADDSLLESSTAKIPASAQIGIISKGEREIHTLHESPARSVPEAMASNVAKNGIPVAIKRGDPIFPGDTLAKVPVVTTASRGGSTEGGSMQSHDGKVASAQTLRMSKLSRPSRTSRLRKAFMKRFSLV